MELNYQLDDNGVIKRRIEFDSWDQATRVMLDLGKLCCSLVKEGFSESNLLTAQECVAYLDLDGDYVIYP